MDVTEWCLVNVGLRQGCVMSPWLFDVYIDGVMPQVNAWVLGIGMKIMLWRTAAC